MRTQVLKVSLLIGVLFDTFSKSNIKFILSTQSRKFYTNPANLPCWLSTQLCVTILPMNFNSTAIFARQWETCSFEKIKLNLFEYHMQYDVSKCLQ